MKKSYSRVTALVAVTAMLAGYPWLALLAMMFCGLAYGGIPTLSAAVTGEFFGRAWYGKNLSILNLSIFPGSFAAMAAGAIQTTSGSYSGAFILFLALEAGAVILMLILGKVRKGTENA